MPATRADIISQLRKDILSWERGEKMRDIGATVTGLGVIQEAFPNHTFPVSAVHEFCSMAPEESAATGGFVSGILSSRDAQRRHLFVDHFFQNYFSPCVVIIWSASGKSDLHLPAKRKRNFMGNGRSAEMRRPCCCSERNPGIKFYRFKKAATCGRAKRGYRLCAQA